MLSIRIFTENNEEYLFDFPQSMKWDYNVFFNDRINPNDIILQVHSRDQVLSDYPEIVEFHKQIRNIKNSISKVLLFKDNFLVFDSSSVGLKFIHNSLQLSESAEIVEGNDYFSYFNEFRFLIVFQYIERNNILTNNDDKDDSDKEE